MAMDLKQKYKEFQEELSKYSSLCSDYYDNTESFTKEDFDVIAAASSGFAVVSGQEELYEDCIKALDEMVEYLESKNDLNK